MAAEELNPGTCRTPEEARPRSSSRRRLTKISSGISSTRTPASSARCASRSRAASRRLQPARIKIGRIMIPTEPVTELRNGKKYTIERVFLPGYVLVEMELDNDLWHVIKNTPRVTGFLGTGDSARCAERGRRSAPSSSGQRCLQGQAFHEGEVRQGRAWFASTRAPSPTSTAPSMTSTKIKPDPQGHGLASSAALLRWRSNFRKSTRWSIEKQTELFLDGVACALPGRDTAGVTGLLSEYAE